jgi:hypothetical protein
MFDSFTFLLSILFSCEYNLIYILSHDDLSITISQTLKILTGYGDSFEEIVNRLVLVAVKMPLN